jgi:arginyl-tRNA synthetase
MLAVNDRDPSKIASWVFQLAQYFMKFYENYSVMNAETTELLQARLLVVSAIKIGIATGLDMLGLPAASKL